MTTCYACGAELVPDSPDSTYQFDNCLWIGFHGGYGMFVDNLDATLPNNTEDRWLRDEEGMYLEQVVDGRVDAVDNPDWKPTFNQERMLRGADYECVICHECAHKLCDTVPWMERLLHPRCSHTHKRSWVAEHPEHPDHHPGCELHDR